MKTIVLPAVALVIVASSLGAVLKLSRERSAARYESMVLAERLARAESVATAVTRMDDLYWEAKVENAVMADRLAAIEAASQMELKDAVAERPKPQPLPLPGYSR